MLQGSSILECLQEMKIIFCKTIKSCLNLRKCLSSPNSHFFFYFPLQNKIFTSSFICRQNLTLGCIMAHGRIHKQIKSNRRMVKRRNGKLHNLYTSPHIIRVIKSRWIWWVKHVIMPEEKKYIHTQNFGHEMWHESKHCTDLTDKY